MKRTSPPQGIIMYNLQTQTKLLLIHVLRIFMHDSHEIGHNVNEKIYIYIGYHVWAHVTDLYNTTVQKR